MDLEYYVRLACEKGVSSLAHNALKFYAPSDAAEAKALDDLRVSYLTASAMNDYHRTELAKILAAFREDGLDAIPLKGISLSERLYGDTTSRDRSVDVDLLVREKDKERGRRILEDIGYSFAPVDEREEYKWYYAFNKQGQKMVELHWDITMMVRSPGRIEGLWRGTEYGTFGGMRYLDFKPEELLLYLAAHLVNSDSFRKLKYICDINRLIEKYESEIDWNSAAKKAEDWRMRGSLYAALKLNRELFEFKIPQGLLRKIGLPLISRVLIRLFADKTVIMKKNSFRRRFLDVFLSYIFLELTEASSFRDVAATLKRVCFK